MDDFGLYIKKEIANLIKRSQTPQYTTKKINSNERSNKKSILVTKSVNKPLWY